MFEVTSIVWLRKCVSNLFTVRWTILWKEVTMDSPHFRRKEMGPTPLRAE